VDDCGKKKSQRLRVHGSKREKAYLHLGPRKIEAEKSKLEGEKSAARPERPAADQSRE
jgi:hypothetical protein